MRSGKGFYADALAASSTDAHVGFSGYFNVVTNQLALWTVS
jgi:hypothetical protein